MIQSHQGLTLCYETADTVVPARRVDYGEAVRAVIGVSPVHTANVVRLRFRVDGGLEQSVSCPLVYTDYSSNKQYFETRFPYLPSGARVDYAWSCMNAGRQVPAPDDCSFPYHFEVSAPSPESSGDSVSSERLAIAPEYLARFTIFLTKTGPEVIGSTPEGLRLNWYPIRGDVVGPKLNAKVRPVGGDWMTIRPDGVGIIDVRGTLETHDGALIYASYTGVFELGENGYANALKGHWPDMPASRSAPRFHTSHPRYLWLNRLQCMAVGHVRMKELIYEYDLYSF